MSEHLDSSNEIISDEESIRRGEAHARSMMGIEADQSSDDENRGLYKPVIPDFFEEEVYDEAAYFADRIIDERAATIVAKDKAIKAARDIAERAYQRRTSN